MEQRFVYVNPHSSSLRCCPHHGALRRQRPGLREEFQACAATAEILEGFIMLMGDGLTSLPVNWFIITMEHQTVT